MPQPARETAERGSLCHQPRAPLGSCRATACYWGSKRFAGTSHSGERLYPTKPEVALGLVSVQRQRLRRGSTANPRAQGLLAPPAAGTPMARRRRRNCGCRVLSPAEAVLASLSSSPHHHPKGCSGTQTPVRTAEPGGAEGAWAAAPFPSY